MWLWQRAQPTVMPMNVSDVVRHEIVERVLPAALAAAEVRARARRKPVAIIASSVTRRVLVAGELLLDELRRTACPC